MTNSPPSTIYCTLNRDENDDHSQVTWKHSEGEDPNEFSIKLAADPYFLYALDGCHPPKTEDQELIELKLQIARQQEKIDALSSRLEKCEDENEELRAVNAQLVDELALANQGQPDPEAERRPGKVAGAPSRPPHLDESAKLAKDNARLGAVVNVMRTSFQAYIRDKRRENCKHEEVAQIMLRENQALRRELSRFTGKKCSAIEEGTARTASSDTLDSEAVERSHGSGPSLARKFSYRPQSTIGQGSSLDWIDEGEVGPPGNSCNNVRINKKMARRQTEPVAMTVNENVRPSRACPADELIVGFRDRRGTMRAGRRWSFSFYPC